MSSPTLPATELPLLACVLATMREGVALLDDQGRIQYANPSLLRLYGRPSDELLAKALALSELGIDGATAGSARHSAVAAPVECHVRDAAGRQLILLLTRSTLRLPGQQLQVCILQDVSDVRQLEQQLRTRTSAELGKLGSTVHEGIAQDLTGISLLLRTVVGKTPADTGQLQTISAHVSRVIADARALARGLSPVQAAGGSLSDALSHCAQDLSAKQGIDVLVRTQLESLTLGTAQSEQLYRMASEALRWVAGAVACSRIEFDLRAQGGELRLELRGNGQQDAAMEGSELQPDLIANLAGQLGGRLDRTAPAGSARALQFSVPLQALAGDAAPGVLNPVSSDHAAVQTSPAPRPS